MGRRRTRAEMLFTNASGKKQWSGVSPHSSQGYFTPNDGADHKSQVVGN